MNEHNPYRGPDSTVAEVAAGDELAGRGARLGAWIIDLVILIVVMIPVMYFGGYYQVIEAAMQGQQPSMATGLMWNFVSLVVFAVIQFYPLNASGQTWGKKILNIRIVDLQGRKPDMVKLLGMRYLLVYAVSCIPYIGFLAYLVNVLMIFRNDQRCGHDLIAGTRVVHAD